MTELNFDRVEDPGVGEESLVTLKGILGPRMRRGGHTRVVQLWGHQDIENHKNSTSMWGSVGDLQVDCSQNNLFIANGKLNNEMNVIIAGYQCRGYNGRQGKWTSGRKCIGNRKESNWYCIIRGNSSMYFEINVNYNVNGANMNTAHYCQLGAGANLWMSELHGSRNYFNAVNNSEYTGKTETGRFTDTVLNFKEDNQTRFTFTMENLGVYTLSD